MLVEEIWEEGRCVLVGERFGKREGVCWWGDLGGEEEGRGTGRQTCTTIDISHSMTSH